MKFEKAKQAIMFALMLFVIPISINAQTKPRLRRPVGREQPKIRRTLILGDVPRRHIDDTPLPVGRERGRPDPLDVPQVLRRHRPGPSRAGVGPEEG